MMIKKLLFLLTTLLLNVHFLHAAVEPYLPETGRHHRVETISLSELRHAADLSRERSLNGTWKCSGLTNSPKPFKPDAREEARYAAPDFDDSGWDDIAVPLNWYLQYKAARNREAPYVKGYYRRHFNVSAAEKSGRRAILHFGVIGYDARVFVNGQEIGSHHGDFTPFELDITDALREGENILAIRVLSDFGPVFGVRQRVSHTYGCQWGIDSIKGGIWQDVTLRFVPEIYISRILIDPRVPEKVLDVRAAVENRTGRQMKLRFSGEVLSALRETAGQSAGNPAAFEVTLKPGRNDLDFRVPVPAIKLWTPDDPQLYYLLLSAEENGKTLTAAAERFGFRDFRARDGKFYLNGEPVYLFGENISSQDFGGWGRSAEEEEKRMTERLLGFRDLGYVMVRTTHMPAVPALARIADECGMMIYSEWGWAFTTLIDPEKFQIVNSKELREFIIRDYNHPSVVMWSLGNEVAHSEPAIGKLMDLQVQTVRELDRSDRPITAFSGVGNWRSFGDARRETDVLDLHSYTGFSQPWTLRNSEIDELYKGLKKIYGQHLPPIIAWELVGFSWGFELNAGFRLNDVEEYRKYATRNFDWANPRGVGLTGAINLAAALDPGRGSGYAQSLYGKRILELYRLDSRIAGFAPWFGNTKLPTARLWTQKVFPGLRNENGLPPRNLFTGEKSQWELVIANDSSTRIETPILELSTIDSTGKNRPLASLKLPEIAPHSRHSQSIQFVIPPETADGTAQLRICLRNRNGEEVGRNYYDLFLCARKRTTAEIKAVRPVWIFDTGVPENINALREFLEQCGIAARQCGNPAELRESGLLIIPPELKPQLLDLADDPILDQWIRNGGILLAFEQKNPESLFPGNLQLREAGNSFVDLVIPSHPFFAGLGPMQFDTWNNSDFGFTVHTSFTPYLINAVAVNGPTSGRTEVDSVLIDAALGSGRVVLSQFELFDSSPCDSAAALFRHNLLGYLAETKDLPKNALPLTVVTGKEWSIAPERIVMINLAPYANRSFSDTRENDGKGGWTDQGKNNFSTIPLGKVNAAGIPFQIIDPAENNGLSCLILRGTEQPGFPAAIRNIKVGEKFSRLFFLHTSAWGRSGETARYRIRYEDGGFADFILYDGRQIGDWWGRNKLSEARRGITCLNPVGAPVTAYVAEWENPHPEKTISTIDFLTPAAARGGAIDYLPRQAPLPILIAVTGEKSHPAPWLVTGNAYRAAHESCLPGSRVKGKVREIPNRQGRALQINFPESTGNQMPAVFLQFSPPPGRNYRYLQFSVKASRSGIVQLEIPEKNWKSRYRAIIMLQGDGKVHHYRLTLGRELKSVGQPFSLEAARNELFVFYPPQPDAAGKTPAMELTFDSIRFE